MAGNANAARLVAKRLEKIKLRASISAPGDAVRALAAAGETATKLTLRKRTHKKGLGIRTNSPPGAPPALVSGRLRGGVMRIPARIVGDGTAFQTLTCVTSYGSVHEFGPVTITARNFPQLGNPEVGFFGQEVVIPRRPWMAPSVEALIVSGKATSVCSTAFARALYR